jgi:hypothetical protein
MNPGQPAGDVAAGRPGIVLAACVIAFALALYEIATGALILIDAGQAATSVAVWYVLGLFHLAVAGALVWGGLAALTGRTEKVLIYTAAVAAIVMVVTFIVQFVSPIPAQGLFMVVVYGVVVVLLTRPQSTAFFTKATPSPPGPDAGA